MDPPDAVSYLIGVDIGTSGTKAVLAHPERGVLAIAEHRYPLHRPFPTWAENDPEDWFRALRKSVSELVATARVPAHEVRGLCIVGQRDPVALVDAAGRVLTPCIHWTDRRDLEETERLYDDLGRERLIDITGVVPIPGLTLPNLAWTKRHLPDVWRQVRHALPAKDYLAYRLTGDVGTDISTPSRSILNDWRREAWSEEICRDVGIPYEILPPVRYGSSEPRAELSHTAAGLLGLAPGTILAVGGGDDQAATLACGVIDVGDISVGTGTSMCLRVVTANPASDPKGRLCLAAHVVPDRYIYELVGVGTGTSFRWFRDVFGSSATQPGAVSSYEELIASAADVEPGADGLLFFPYVEGASLPYFDDAARGVFFGIVPGHTRAHFVRAIMEGIAYNYPPLLDILADFGSPIGSMTIVDGEARSPLWNAIKADVMGRELRTTGAVEAAAIGAAILAGLACRTFPTAADGVTALVAPGEVIRPDPARHARYESLRNRWEAVRRHQFDAFHVFLQNDGTVEGGGEA